MGRIREEQRCILALVHRVDDVSNKQRQAHRHGYNCTIPVPVSSVMYLQLIHLIEEQEESKAGYEIMQVKLEMIREARGESLNDMRAQHA